MSGIVGSELAARFEAHSEEPSHREQVLITLGNAVSRATLVACGLDVRFISRDGRIVAGSLDATGLKSVAELPGVEQIEADTEMHALNGE